jgi:hypothetical protein
MSPKAFSPQASLPLATRSLKSPRLPENEASDTGLNHESRHLITTHLMPVGEQLCLADFNHASPGTGKSMQQKREK